MGALSIQVRTGPHYEVRVGRGILRECAARSEEWTARLVLSDANVAPLYAHALALPADVPMHVVAAGEGSKSFAELERVLDALARAGLDRHGVLLALGGGVVGDLGGLAAALYMRGIDCVQLPTTLLAQVDSSVGGKTAVNLAAGKNLAGVFHQPALVLADTQTLATLDEEEYRSGLGEVLKTALISGGALFELCERECSRLLARDADLLAEVVAACVRTKAAVVEFDPHERGARKQLNLGHTFAHAIEHAAGYGAIPHGIAVGVGLVLALELAARLAILRDAALAPRVRTLLSACGMPASLGELRQRYRSPLDPAVLAPAMRLDKKSSAGRPRFVLPRGAGELVLDVEADPDALAAVLRAS